MKDYKEVADEVLKRSEKILSDSLRKKKKTLRICSLTACFALIMLMGYGIWQNNAISIGKPNKGDNKYPERTTTENVTNIQEDDEQETMQTSEVLEPHSTDVLDSNTITDSLDNTSLQYNIVESYEYGAPSVAMKTKTEQVVFEDIADILGFNIKECLPYDMKQLELQYARIYNSDTNQTVGVGISGWQVDEVTLDSFGFFMEITFEDVLPNIDYTYSEEKTVYNIINGIEICASIISERNYFTQSGREKHDPAKYSVSFTAADTHYFIETQGEVGQAVFDELVYNLASKLSTLN